MGARDFAGVRRLPRRSPLAAQPMQCTVAEELPLPCFHAAPTLHQPRGDLTGNDYALVVLTRRRAHHAKQSQSRRSTINRERTAHGSAEPDHPDTQRFPVTSRSPRRRRSPNRQGSQDSGHNSVWRIITILQLPHSSHAVQSRDLQAGNDSALVVSTSLDHHASQAAQQLEVDDQQRAHGRA